MALWRLYRGLEFPQTQKFLCRSLMGHVLRHVFGDGVGKELGLTFMEHKLCLSHSSGTCPPTQGGRWNYPPIL